MVVVDYLEVTLEYVNATLPLHLHIYWRWIYSGVCQNINLQNSHDLHWDMQSLIYV